MASIKKLQPNQIVFEIRRQKMGNTTLSYGALYRVKIIEVNHEKEYAIASWNGNTPQKYTLSSIKKWKVAKPEVKRRIMGIDSYL